MEFKLTNKVVIIRSDVSSCAKHLDTCPGTGHLLRECTALKKGDCQKDGERKNENSKKSKVPPP